MGHFPPKCGAVKSDAVGMKVQLTSPRTEPHWRFSRIWLLPQLCDGKLSICSPEPVTRGSGSTSGTVLCWSALPLVPVLRSTGSAADRSVLFDGFIEWRRFNGILYQPQQVPRL